MFEFKVDYLQFCCQYAIPVLCITLLKISETYESQIVAKIKCLTLATSRIIFCCCCSVKYPLERMFKCSSLEKDRCLAKVSVVVDNSIVTRSFQFENINPCFLNIFFWNRVNFHF